MLYITIVIVHQMEFSVGLNASNYERDVIDGARLFQTLAAATKNARSPIVVQFVLGNVYSDDADHSRQREPSLIGDTLHIARDVLRIEAPFQTDRQRYIYRQEQCQQDKALSTAGLSYTVVFHVAVLKPNNEV